MAAKAVPVWRLARCVDTQDMEKVIAAHTAEEGVQLLSYDRDGQAW
jgi:hypothetical protein